MDVTIHNRRGWTWWRRYKAPSAHNQANIVFGLVVMVATAGYSITAGVQLHVMQRASEDSAAQTKQLIDAATKTEAAAEKSAKASSCGGSRGCSDSDQHGKPEC